MKKQSRILALIILLCGGGFAFTSAQNLVPDSSFEDVSNHYCGIVSSAAQFNSIFNNWNTGSEADADMYSLLVDTTCFNHCTNPSPSGPIPPKGSQAPLTGDVYAGIFLYTINGLEQRDYIQTALSTALVPGNTYEVSAWVSLADFSEFASSDFDFLFTTNPVYLPNRFVLNMTPQVENSAVLASTTDWMQVKDTFTADSAYTHLTLGNFNGDLATSLSPNPGSGGGPGQYGAYYFVEDVSVVQVATPLNTREALVVAKPILPQTFWPTRMAGFQPSYPQGGETSTLVVYQVNGQEVFRQTGSEASWTGSGASEGIYLWQLEWIDTQGFRRMNRGKVLLMQ